MAETIERVEDGVSLIAAERRRQIEEKGFTPERDDTYEVEQLALAAVHYALTEWDHSQVGDEYWPADWDDRWNQRDDDDRITQLVKAGALIAAEIDRLQRLAARQAHS